MGGLVWGDDGGFGVVLGGTGSIFSFCCSLTASTIVISLLITFSFIPSFSSSSRGVVMLLLGQPESLLWPRGVEMVDEHDEFVRGSFLFLKRELAQCGSMP